MYYFTELDLIKKLFYTAATAFAIAILISTEAMEEEHTSPKTPHTFYVEEYTAPGRPVAHLKSDEGYGVAEEGSIICFHKIHLTTFLEILQGLGQAYTIKAKKIYAYADIGNDGREIFDAIFEEGAYATNYLRDPERFLDCIISGEPMELSAQEDLRQELIKLGWTDESAKECEVIAYISPTMRYKYKSTNPRLIKQ